MLPTITKMNEFERTAQDSVIRETFHFAACSDCTDAYIHTYMGQQNSAPLQINLRILHQHV